MRINLKTERKESFCKWFLLLLLTLSLAASVIQSLREKPFQLYGTLGLLWDAELIQFSGMLFPLTQIGSAMSGIMGWIAVRLFKIPFQAGLLLPPTVAIIGFLLLHFRKKTGRTLLLIVQLPVVPFVMILFLVSLLSLPFSENTNLALQQTIYYLGMTIGRFLSGVFARKLHSWQIVKIGLAVLGAALAVLVLVPNDYVTVGALMLVGIGNGPMFPNFNYLAPENFGEKRSPAIIGTQMAVSGFAFVAGQMCCGLLGQAFGMRTFPFYLIAFYGLMLAAFLRAAKLWTMPRIFWSRTK